MTPRRDKQATSARELWAAQIDALDAPTKQPLAPDRIVAAALTLVETHGFDALTMRKVASALGVTAGALYVHVNDRAALGDLMLAELFSRVVVPEPDPTNSFEQARDVCRQLHDQYALYPGIGYAVFEAAPLSLEALRITEGLLSILTTGGADVRSAAWAVDSALLFITASGVMTRRRSTETGGFNRDELIARYRMLPAERFPITTANADAITSGDRDERFDATLRQLFSGLVPSQDTGHEH